MPMQFEPPIETCVITHIILYPTILLLVQLFRGTHGKRHLHSNHVYIICVPYPNPELLIQHAKKKEETLCIDPRLLCTPDRSNCKLTRGCYWSGSVLSFILDEVYSPVPEQSLNENSGCTCSVLPSRSEFWDTWGAQLSILWLKPSASCAIIEGSARDEQDVIPGELVMQGGACAALLARGSECGTGKLTVEYLTLMSQLCSAPYLNFCLFFA